MTMIINEVQSDGTSIKREVATFRLDGVFPVGYIVEGTSTIQNLCPYCPYGAESTESFIAVAPTMVVIQCRKCGKRYAGLG